MAGLTGRRRLALAVGASIGVGAAATASLASTVSVDDTGNAETATRRVAVARPGRRVLAQRPDPAGRQLGNVEAPSHVIEREIATRRRALSVAPVPRSDRRTIRAEGLTLVTHLPIVVHDRSEHLVPLRMLADPPPPPLRVPAAPPQATRPAPAFVDPLAGSAGSAVPAGAPAPAPVDVEPTAPIPSSIDPVAVTAPDAAAIDLVPESVVLEAKTSAPTVVKTVKGAAAVTAAAGSTPVAGRSETSAAPVIAAPSGEYTQRYDSAGGSIAVLIDPTNRTVYLSDVSPADGWVSSVSRNDGKVKVTMKSDAGTVTFSIRYSGANLVEENTFSPKEPPPPPDDDDDHDDDDHDDDHDDHDDDDHDDDDHDDDDHDDDDHDDD